MTPSSVAHQAGAYPGFRSMKRLVVFCTPPGWYASPSQGIPTIKFTGTHLYTWMERGNVRVKCLAQKHNTMSLVKARTRTAPSGDERTNHEATALPTQERCLQKNHRHPSRPPTSFSSQMWLPVADPASCKPQLVHTSEHYFTAQHFEHYLSLA